MRFLVLLLSNEKGTAFVTSEMAFECAVVSSDPQALGNGRPAAAGFLDLGDPIPGSLGAFETFWIKAAPT
jgi:hypothetical protein